MSRFAAMACALGALSTTALGQLLGPTPYLSTADSPFAAMPGFVFDDVEDGAMNLLGVTTNGLVIGPGGLTDSVDIDDGAIDGSGTNGHSLFGTGSVGINFVFDAVALGGAPTHVGIVWTDGSGEITFTAFDTLGNSLGSIVGNHADGDFVGGTGEDRFYGVINPGGIGSILIQNTSGGIEVDHIQLVGTAVPAPGALGLLGVAGLAASRRRRRH